MQPWQETKGSAAAAAEKQEKRSSRVAAAEPKHQQRSSKAAAAEKQSSRAAAAEGCVCVQHQIFALVLLGLIVALNHGKLYYLNFVADCVFLGSNFH